MRVIKQIVNNFLLFSILVSFMLSTSGFVITRHVCKHHSTEIELCEVGGECCKIEKEVTQTASCCSTEKDSDNDKSDECCQFEKTYFRLSENFVLSEKSNFSKETLLYSNCALKNVITNAAEINLPVFHPNDAEQEKIPKPKKYLLFHQIKVEPPLI
jgi:hypothetical protein